MKMLAGSVCSLWQTPAAQGRSAEFISMIKWIWTGRSSVKNSLSTLSCPGLRLAFRVSCRVAGLGFEVEGFGAWGQRSFSPVRTPGSGEGLRFTVQ